MTNVFASAEPEDQIVHMSLSVYEARLDEARLEGYDQGYDAALEYIDRQNEEAVEEADDYDPGLEEPDFEPAFDEPVAEEGDDDR